MNLKHPGSLVRLLLLLGMVGCAEDVFSDEIGQPRVVAQVGGDPPTLVGVEIDREGRIYVAEGSREQVVTTRVHVGPRSGGTWHHHCEWEPITSEPTFGWLGAAAHHAWLWTGHRILEVNGTTGECALVLERDPQTGSRLDVLGALPAVSDRASTTTAVVIVRSRVAPQPLLALLDLRAHRYLHLGQIDAGRSPESFEVLGVGTDDSAGGVFLVRQENEAALVFVNASATVTDRVRVEGELSPVTGSLKMAGDLTVGLLSDGDLLWTSRTEARRVAIPDEWNFEVRGVHEARGKLYLVGIRADRPALVELSPGSFGTPVVWSASEVLSEELNGDLSVRDERSTPIAEVIWPAQEVRTLAPPFVDAWEPSRFDDERALVFVLGPHSLTGGVRLTQVAVAQGRLSYP